MFVHAVPFFAIQILGVSKWYDGTVSSVHVDDKLYCSLCSILIGKWYSVPSGIIYERVTSPGTGEKSGFHGDSQQNM